MKNPIYILLAFALLIATNQKSQAQIIIDSIVPANACLGDPFIVFGTGMTNVNSVTVAGNNASIIASNSGSVVASVPNSVSSSGNAAVVVSDGNNSATGSISVDYADASFSYPGYFFCADNSSISPTITGTSGGSFYAPPSTNINASTGQILLGSSAVGINNISYTVTAPGGCVYTSVEQIEILKVPTPKMWFILDTFCTGSPFDKPIILDYDSTGYFTYNSLGNPLNFLAWVSTSVGMINFAASDPGTYEIIYQVPGFCSGESRDTITILATADATFAYDTTVFCLGDPNPIPSFITTPGGIFTDNTMSIYFEDNTTGEINLDSSGTGGPFPITYTIGGTCPSSYTFPVIILLDCGTGMAEDASGFLSVFPNPARDRATLRLNQAGPGLAGLRILNLLGQEIRRQDLPGGPEATLRLDGIPRGMYILEVFAGAKRLNLKLEIQ